MHKEKHYLSNYHSKKYRNIPLPYSHLYLVDLCNISLCLFLTIPSATTLVLNAIISHFYYCNSVLTVNEPSPLFTIFHLLCVLVTMLSCTTTIPLFTPTIVPTSVRNWPRISIGTLPFHPNNNPLSYVLLLSLFPRGKLRLKEKK
jgi:hypothetical protein